MLKAMILFSILLVSCEPNGNEHTSPASDLQYFKSLPDNSYNMRKNLYAFRTLLAASGGSLNGPKTIANNDGTTTIRYVAINQYKKETILEWKVSKSRKLVKPMSTDAAEIQKAFIKDLSK